MRIFRFIGLLAVLGVLWVVGSLLWTLMSPTASRMDAYAGSRIRRECGWESNCKVKAGELFEGTWDALYVFGAGVTQNEIDAILGRGHVLAGDLERIVVLESNHHVVRVERAAAPAGKPKDGEIEFEEEDHRGQRIVRYEPNQWLRVTGFPLKPTGRFYVLSAIEDQ